jgi:hypothetical protein
MLILTEQTKEPMEVHKTVKGNNHQTVAVLTAALTACVCLDIYKAKQRKEDQGRGTK